MSSEVSSSEQSSSSFHLLDERIQRWIWQAGWTELKDAQERAIPLILSGADDLIIAAATASGKTEAAFFPILTSLLASKTPACVLYISPLKALINDQWGRLEQLCQSLEIPVVAWHGDISESRKRQFLKKPEGCLLITPESLEGLLMRHGHAIQGPFGALVYVVIDELHAFIGTERGKQLQSLMYRIDTALKRRVVRIGLSATLGEMRLAAEFLRPGSGEKVQIIQSNDAGQELKVVVKGYYSRESAAKDDGLPSEIEAINEHLYKTLRGSNNLVFPNSRSLVEVYSDRLRRLCEMNAVPNEFWPHHGSLAKDIRQETEKALKAGDRPATAIATTTLELGIDIGAVKSVAQIGSAPSVASLRQRLGRSGRRRGEPAILRCYCIEAETTSKTHLSDRLREGLLQTAAQIRLLVKGWYEPPQADGLHLSTLVQQLLSIIAQNGGVYAAQAWSVLCESGTFRGISEGEFTDLLRGLGEKEILMQDSSGLLLHGRVGERLVNHYSFLAAFSADEEFRVVSAGKTLGTLPLSRPVEPGSFVIFAGRRWQVLACLPQERLIDVTPAKDGKPPIFDGMGGKVHDGVRAEMRSILAESLPVPFLDETAAAQLEEARGAYAQFDLARKAAVQTGSETCLFTWRGDRINDTLALMLSRRGLRAINEGICLVVLDSECDRVLDAFYDISNEPAPTAHELVEAVQNKLREKWDGLLPVALLDKSFASREVDVAGALESARQLFSSSKAEIPQEIRNIVKKDRLE